MKPRVRDVVVAGLVLSFSLLLSAGGVAAAPASAPDATLKGTYSRTVYRSCVLTNTPPGFGENGNDISVGGNGSSQFPQLRMSASRGKVTFNGDGTGTLESILGRMRLTSTSIAGGNPSGARVTRFPRLPFARREAMCTFDYSVSPDGSFLMNNFRCESENIPKGRDTGNPSRVTGIVIEGQMANGGQTLLLTDNDTNIETIESLDPLTGQVAGVFERICVRSGAAVRVGN